MLFSIYLLIGIFTGFMSGLFGISGGVIVIPALSNSFTHYGVIPKDYTMHMAIGTSLAIMIFTAASALHAHHKRKAVDWIMFRKMLSGLIMGAIVGAMVAHFLPSSFLRIIFSLFLIVISLRLIFKVRSQTQEKNASLTFIRISSFAIGIFSSLKAKYFNSFVIPIFFQTPCIYIIKY